jgi:NADPH2:quinone reductase
MKAMICRDWGTPEALTLAELPSRPLGQNEVRIRVRAAGINFADSLQIAGKYQVKPPLPFTPGLEVSGEISEIGPGLARPYALGQRVLAFLRFGGGYADEVATSADCVLPIHDGIDDITAAGFPTAYGTSFYGLTHRGKLQPGETLLVLGAAGGVGLTAVEIGKLLGARVIAAAGGAEKCALTREYGADHTIDYTRESIRDRVREITDGKGADVVYDPVGGDAFDQAIRAVNWDARMLVIGFASGRIQQVPANLVLVKNIAVTGVVFGEQNARDPVFGGSFITEMLRWHAAGKLRPRISKTFPLAEAPAALNALLSRKYPGKIVLTV